MQFHELTDKQWDLIKPSIPNLAHTGRPRADDRTVINGILYVLLSGCRWMECHPNTVLTRQSGKGTRNGVREASGRKLWILWFPVATAMV